MGFGNVDPKYEEWDNVVSEFDQLLWDQHCKAARQIEQNPAQRGGNATLQKLMGHVNLTWVV